MTEKLYYEDSHMRDFSARVLSCHKNGEYYEAVLDRTAFFPKGGGQLADTGYIDKIEVVDVYEKENVVYHVVKECLEKGKEVVGQLNWDERFYKMQHHSGEHIVSGLVHKKYGFDNVGFHMGSDAVTMDFNGTLTKEQWKEIEMDANLAVWRNVPVLQHFPDEKERTHFQYRSKMEIEGQVRIIEIPNYDMCACCAPHVLRTGEIGIIKFTGIQNYKGGTRVSMLCGYDALRDYIAKADTMKEIAVMMSIKEHQVLNEVIQLREALYASRVKEADLEKRLLSYKVDEFGENKKLVVVFEEDLNGIAIREMANLLLEKKHELVAVFSGHDEQGYRYVIGSHKEDARQIASMLNEQFDGKGGGKKEMVQGSLRGMQSKITEALTEWKERA